MYFILLLLKKIQIVPFKEFAIKQILAKFLLKTVHAGKGVKISFDLNSCFEDVEFVDVVRVRSPSRHGNH